MFHHITIAGAGVQGSQLAVQIAFKGYPVTVWVRSEESKQRAAAKINAVQQNYINAIKAMSQDTSFYCKSLCTLEEAKNPEILRTMLEKAENLAITLTTSQEQAFADADLIIETVKEDIGIKQEFYAMLGRFLKENAVVTTNTSSLAPSELIQNENYKERFLMLHFASPVIKCNMAEVMRIKETRDDVFESVYEFAGTIGMSPTRINSELPRGVLNFMLIPWMAKAAYLWGADIASPQDIDKTWMAGTMHCVGPFMLMDAVGLNIVYEILMTMDGANTEGHPFCKVRERVEEMMKNNQKFYNS